MGDSRFFAFRIPTSVVWFGSLFQTWSKTWRVMLIPPGSAKVWTLLPMFTASPKMS